jgi:hypothetical protein
VEVQEFSVQHVYSQLAYRESQASIIDRRGATGAMMSKLLDLSEVTMHPTNAEVESLDGRASYRIGIAQTFVSLFDFADLEDARTRTASFFEAALDYLDGPSIASGQIRTIDIAPAESFDAVRESLMASLAGGSGSLQEAVGIKLNDVGWVIEFEEPDVAAKLQFGPMKSDQLTEILKAPDDSSYPPALVFIGLETAFNAGDEGAESGLDWWSHCLDRNRKLSERISTWISEKLDES